MIPKLILRNAIIDSFKSFLVLFHDEISISNFSAVMIPKLVKKFYEILSLTHSKAFFPLYDEILILPSKGDCHGLSAQNVKFLSKHRHVIAWKLCPRHDLRL